MGFYGFPILVCRFPSFTAAFHWTRSRCSLNETLTSRRLLSTIIIFFAATTSATSHENWWNFVKFREFFLVFPVFFLVFKSHHLLFVGCCAFSGSLSANQRGLWGPGSGTVQEFVDPKVGLWAQQFPWIVRWIVYIYIYTYLVHGISVVLNHGIYIYISE